MSPMETQAIKAHKLAHGFLDPKPTSLALGSNPTSIVEDPVNTNFYLKRLIRSESVPITPASSEYVKKQSPQVEGGSRWNPSEEQIGILEMLCRSGMRTPTTHQIEQITAQLAQYGKIEGKNVFYWFQNHKARERQKQKRKVEEELSSIDLWYLTHHQQEVLHRTKESLCHGDLTNARKK